MFDITKYLYLIGKLSRGVAKESLPIVSAVSLHISETYFKHFETPIKLIVKHRNFHENS